MTNTDANKKASLLVKFDLKQNKNNGIKIETDEVLRKKIDSKK